MNLFPHGKCNHLFPRFMDLNSTGNLDPNLKGNPPYLILILMNARMSLLLNHL